MTLREMRAAYPHLFHPNQDWFLEERFLDKEPEPMPPGKCRIDHSDEHPDASLLTAATLAHYYTANPTDPFWRAYLWTKDFDRYGQRVFVGDNGKGLEIHRHLKLSDRWRCPVWS